MSSDSNLLNADLQEKLTKLTRLTDNKTTTSPTNEQPEVVNHKFYDKKNTSKLLYTLDIQINRDADNNIVSEYIINKQKP